MTPYILSLGKISTGLPDCHPSKDVMLIIGFSKQGFPFALLSFFVNFLMRPFGPRAMTAQREECKTLAGERRQFFCFRGEGSIFRHLEEAKLNGCVFFCFLPAAVITNMDGSANRETKTWKEAQTWNHKHGWKYIIVFENCNISPAHLITT